MIIGKEKRLGEIKNVPYQIHSLNNIYTVIQIGTDKVMGRFKSLQEAETFMWSLIPRLK